MTALQALEASDTGVILSLTKADPGYWRRPLSMGLTPGTAFEIALVARLLRCAHRRAAFLGPDELATVEQTADEDGLPTTVHQTQGCIHLATGQGA